MKIELTWDQFFVIFTTLGWTDVVILAMIPGAMQHITWENLT